VLHFCSSSSTTLCGIVNFERVRDVSTVGAQGGCTGGALYHPIVNETVPRVRAGEVYAAKVRNVSRVGSQ
jgi:hypothetical protein